MFSRVTGLAATCVLLNLLVGCNKSNSGSTATGSAGAPPASATPSAPLLPPGAGGAGDADTDSPDSGVAADGGSSETDSAGKWAEHTQNLPFIVGYEKGLAEAKAKNKPVMLFVTTTWCGYCTKLAHENFTDSQIKDLLGKFVLVIVDGDTETGALNTLGATEGFPHIIFQSPSGEKLGEQLGYAPVPDFKQVIESALAKSGQS